MNTPEIFLIAMRIIFSVPYLVWRLARTGYHRAAHPLHAGWRRGISGGRCAAGGVGVGKLAGVGLAGRILGWQRGEARLIGWLL